MVKKIVLFPDGSAGVIDTSSSHTVRINGKESITELDATDATIKKYFPDLVEPEIEIK